jgi:FdhD protein
MHAEQGFVAVPIQKTGGAVVESCSDRVAVEEPLEIRLAYGPTGQRTQRSVSVTMRTPGDDGELAVGFLLSEGIVRTASDLEGVRPCGPAVGPQKLHNVVRVDLKPDVAVDLKRLERHFYTTSSCGVCGKTSLEALAVGEAPTIDPERPTIAAAVVHALPDKLRLAQAVFERTGGLHAAALFDAAGELLCVREDVGRHNAVDKVVGAQLRAGRLPGRDLILFVSGRASFELMQKALMAGIPILAAVGAPSSLAVELAERFHMTLLGFVRNGRFNVYSGGGRLR